MNSTYEHPGYEITGSEIFNFTDVINLHWITYFQSTDTIADILSFGKPVIWTLHDQNAFTGGCHYSAECQNYSSDCLNCPQLVQDELNLPMLNLADKGVRWDVSNLTIVTPSKWLSNCVKKSRLLQGVDTRVIPNGIEIENHVQFRSNVISAPLSKGKKHFEKFSYHISICINKFICNNL